MIRSVHDQVVEANRQWYEAEAADYAAYRASDEFLNRYRETFDADFALMGLDQGAQVADCCAGAGLLSRLFADRGCSVTAVDVSAAMLAHIGPPVVTVEADVNDFLRDRPDTFDCVAVGSALHHLWDYVEVVELALGSLRAGGALYIVAEPVAKSGVAGLVRQGEFAWRKLRNQPGDFFPAIRRRLAFRRGSAAPEVVPLFAEVHAHGIDQQRVLAAILARAEILRLRETRSQWLRGVKRLVPGYGGDNFTLVARNR